MDTRGWDVIYVVRRDIASQDLERNMAKLLTEFECIQKLGATSVEIRGEFGAWSIASTGSIRYVQITMPIASGTAVLASDTATLATVDIAGVVLTMQFELGFVQGSPDQPTELKFAVVRAGTLSEAAAQAGVVAVVAVDCSKCPSADAAAWFKAVFHDEAPDLFVRNKSKLDYVFAMVNPVPPTGSSWMTPKALAYAYWNSGDGYLVVLTKTAEGTTSDLPLTPDSSLFYGDQDAFVALSQEMFLRHLVLPGLGAGYRYQTASRSPDGMEIGTITNDGTVALPPATESLVTYYPQLTSFTMIVDDDQLKTTAEGSFDFHMPNASIAFSCSLTNTFAYENGAASFPVTANSHDYTTHVPWYDYVMVGGVGAIAVAAVSNVVGSNIAGDVADSLGSLSAVGTGVVTWGSSLPHFAVANAVLSQALLLQCSSTG